ncbi:FkbM family methyltransferase [Anaerocolumna cellulosilytica]|uniref:FkbM family methyltransferase n=1 Tax=Anaerocolumna cellulosilytica TaxID=433286 RepID=UPI00161EAF85|nr:FkbM family methyltransferase [Anaerocolumna cellulosilytica]MBB5193951.1 FkbM family methyltransferase [Anaerocolumna cellulosilytica]
MDKEQSTDLIKIKKQLSDIIPFYEEDKLFYDNISKSFLEWKETGEVYIEESLVSDLILVYERLEDEESKLVLDWYIKFKIALTIIQSVTIVEGMYPYPTNHSRIELGKIAASKIKKNGEMYCIEDYLLNTELYLISETWICETYLLEDRCEPQKNDIVLDIGAYKGETSIWFAKKVGESGKVYSFEIMPSHVSFLENNIYNNGFDTTIQVVKKGLWDESTKLGIIESGDASKCITSEGEMYIEVITMDSFVEENKLQSVDFIKMDIEGAELRALKGGINTIKTFKPKLAICAYHKYQDIIQIPLWLKSIVPEYRIYLAQKTPVAHSIVLYATAI